MAAKFISAARKFPLPASAFWLQSFSPAAYHTWVFKASIPQRSATIYGHRKQQSPASESADTQLVHTEGHEKADQMASFTSFEKTSGRTGDSARMQFSPGAEEYQETSSQPSPVAAEMPVSPKYNEIRLRYQLSLPTLRSLSTIEKAPDRRKVLQTACLAAEFRCFPIRPEEKNLLREINDHTGIPYPITRIANESWQKVSLLVQIDLLRTGWPNKISANARKELLSESGRIYIVLDKVLRCLADILGEREDGRGVTVTLDVLRSVKAKVWEGTDMELLQVDGIGAAKMKRLVDAGVKTIKQLAGLEFYHIERLLSRNPPFGHQMIHQLSGFPLLHLHLDAVTKYTLAQDNRQNTTTSVPHSPCVVRVVLGFANEIMPTWRKRCPWTTLVIEGEDGRLLWFWRGSVKRIENSKIMFARLDVKKGETIKATFACEGIIGTLVRFTLTV
ncbi:hypothetical protein ACHAO4_000792 [Trichoderma viride]